MNVSSTLSEVEFKHGGGWVTICHADRDKKRERCTKLRRCELFRVNLPLLLFNNAFLQRGTIFIQCRLAVLSVLAEIIQTPQDLILLLFCANRGTFRFWVLHFNKHSEVVLKLNNTTLIKGKLYFTRQFIHVFYLFNDSSFFINCNLRSVEWHCGYEYWIENIPWPILNYTPWISWRDWG